MLIVVVVVVVAAAAVVVVRKFIHKSAHPHVHIAHASTSLLFMVWLTHHDCVVLLLLLSLLLLFVVVAGFVVDSSRCQSTYACRC